MSSSILPTTAPGIQNFTRSVMQGIDANGDGQLSVEEFSNFLDTFMKSLTGAKGQPSAATGTSTVVGTTPLLSTTAAGAASRLNEPLPACPPGWDRTKWADPTHTSIKYVAGRIMARYAPSDWVNEGTREQILADFRAAGLNPTASGKDKCDFNDGYGPVDLVQAAGEGGKAWQWLNVR